MREKKLHLLIAIKPNRYSVFEIQFVLIIFIIYMNLSNELLDN